LAFEPKFPVASMNGLQLVGSVQLQNLFDTTTTTPLKNLKFIVLESSMYAHCTRVDVKNRRMFPVLTSVSPIDGCYSYEFSLRALNTKLYYFLEANKDKIQAAKTLYMCLRRVYKNTMDKNLIKQICNVSVYDCVWERSISEAETLRRWKEEENVKEEYIKLGKKLDHTKQKRDEAEERTKRLKRELLETREELEEYMDQYRYIGEEYDDVSTKIKILKNEGYE
jgi:hypothetical protein